jgi:hypothetical protein
MGLALLGALGGAAFLEACSAEAVGMTPEQVAETTSALSGTTNINWVDTVPNLRSLVGAANWIAIVEGRSALNDGGGGVFAWSTTAVLDNDGTVVNPGFGTNPGWRRIFSGAVDVRWFGAKGDGLQASAVGNFGAFFSALATLPATGGKISSRGRSCWPTGPRPCSTIRTSGA